MWATDALFIMLVCLAVTVLRARRRQMDECCLNEDLTHFYRDIKGSLSEAAMARLYRDVLLDCHLSITVAPIYK